MAKLADARRLGRRVRKDLRVQIPLPALFLSPSSIVESVVDFFQGFIREVGVDLRRLDARVAEHFLDRPQIRSVHQ